MYKVLIVDDEINILDGMTRLLDWDEYGLEIRARAANGIEAFDILEKQEIDILITDIKMPKMNGLELIKRVHDNRMGIKCIVLSGYDDFIYVKEAARLGIENYLLKPLDKAELISTLLDTVKKIENEKQRITEIKEGISIIRENILCRWVNNNISSEELEARAELLSVNLKSKYYLAAVANVIELPAEGAESDIEEKLRIRYLVKNAIQQTLNESGCGIAFLDQDGDLIVVFGMENDGGKDKKNTIYSILNECVGDVRMNLNEHLFIAVGSFELGYKNAWKSFVNAKKLLDYRFITRENIAFYSDMEDFKKTKLYKAIDFKALYRFILSRDIAGINVLIDDLFSRLEASDKLSNWIVQYFSYEIVFFIANNINALYPINENLLYSGNNVFDKFPKTTDPEIIKKWLKTFACEYISSLDSEETKFSPVINKVFDYLDKNYMNDINLKTIAASLSMNPIYLGQAFRKETGKYFTEYLNNFRIEKAKQMLIEGSVKVNVVSKAVGYSNTNYFYTLFKKINGISPTEFKALSGPAK